MKLKNKIISFALIFTFAFSAGSFAAFTDMPEGDAGRVIQNAVNNGLLSGFEDNTVRPNDPITRAQMATIMARALGAPIGADISGYTDVKKQDWFYTAMSRAVYMQAFVGDGVNLYPNNNITRQEAICVLARIFNPPAADEAVLNSYTDGADTSQWARGDVSSMAAAGYIEKSGALRPLDAITRLEFAQILDKLVQSYISVSGEYTAENLPEGNILVRADNVTFKSIKTTNNIYIGDACFGAIPFADCEVKRIVVRGGNCILESGTYDYVGAIGANTVITLEKSPGELVRKNEDGTTGTIYAREGKGSINLRLEDIELPKK